MLGQEPNKPAKQTEVKQRHPGFIVSNETPVTPGRTAKPQEVIRSDAVKQLNREGYYVYNTPEKQDVYITIQPDTAFFDDEEPQMVRMAGGSFVSGNKHTEAFTMPVRSEPVPEPMNYTQPSDMFRHAIPREPYDEIDFTTVIIKKNESFEKEIEAEPVLFSPPSYKEVYDPVIDQSFAVKKDGAVAATSAGAAAPMPMSMKETFIGYREELEYVEEAADIEEETTAAEEYIVIEEMPVTAEEELIEEPPVTEVPVGLHVEGNRPIDVAEMDVGATVVRSSFIEMSVDAELAATESKPMEAEVPIIEHIPIVQEMTEISAETVPDMNTGKDSETVAGPAVIEIADEAEMLLITVPDLHMCGELVSEFSFEKVRTVPDDGLESYDCIFRNAPVTETALAVVSVTGMEESAPNSAPVKFDFR